METQTDPISPPEVLDFEEGKVVNGTHNNLPSAPKGKPKAPPLIIRKIKPSEAGIDDVNTSGSKIPILKTKQSERELKIEERRRAASSSNLGNSTLARRGYSDQNHHHQSRYKMESPRSRSQVSSRMSVNRSVSVERVKVSKGIQMQRVVHDGNGLVPKRYNSSFSSTALSKNKSTFVRSKDSTSSQSSNSRRKMTKTEASFNSVKNFSLVPPLKTHNQVENKKPTAEEKENKLPSSISTALDIAPASTPSDTSTAVVGEQDLREQEKENVTEDKKPQEGSYGETDVNDAIASFKTVEEFMKMPETALPAPSTSKRTLYKSKFWDYIDPSSKSQSASKCSLKKPHYNPDEVKTYMQKQKEIRRQQQLKESKEKQEEAEKRQRMLKELNNKCQRIALRGKIKSEELISNQNLPEDESKAKKRKIELESPSLKYMRPLLEHKHGVALKKTESKHALVAPTSNSKKANDANNAQFLLSQFESIVKRECISFLEKIPFPHELLSPTTTVGTSAVEKVDKSVGTSLVCDPGISSSSHGTSKILDEEDPSTSYSSSKGFKFTGPEEVEKAATKIQALFKGYKVRKTLKNAGIVLGTSISQKRKTQEDLLHQQQQPTEQRGRPTRRWSFPKAPEKPYDNNTASNRTNKLLPMSPTIMSSGSLVGGRKSSEPLIPCYIPPPPPASGRGQKPRSPSRPKVLPSSPFTPVKFRVYDEPYPKQVLKTGGQQQRLAEDDRLNSSLPQNLDDFFIPTPLPSIMDVLREKIRLFSEKTDRLISGDLTEQDNVRQQLCGEGPKSAPHALISARELIASQSQSCSSQFSQATVEETDMTPKIRKPKRRSRSKPRTSSSPRRGSSSTTTADTDAEYPPSLSNAGPAITQSQSEGAFAPNPKENRLPSPSSSRSEGSLNSSTITVPSLTSSFGEFLPHALRLQYEAEREHLKIIEKALHVKLNSANITHLRPSSSDPPPLTRQGQEGSSKRTSKSSPDSDRVQLAIANCHKESLKAAAEMAKWMAEFQKTTQSSQAQAQTQTQQSSVNLAAMVYAAVEEARQIGEQKRQEQKLKAQQSQTNVDKSVETGLSLLQRNKESSSSYADVSAMLTKPLKDYQQQFPSASESERGSPLLVKPSKQSPVHEDADASSETTLKSTIPQDKSEKSEQIVEQNTFKSASIPSEECSLDSPGIDHTSFIPEDLSGSGGENELSSKPTSAKIDTENVSSALIEKTQEEPSESQQEIETPSEQIQTSSILLEGNVLTASEELQSSSIKDSSVVSPPASVSLEVAGSESEKDIEESSHVAEEHSSSKVNEDQFASSFESDINTSTPIPRVGTEEQPLSVPGDDEVETDEHLTNQSSNISSQKAHEDERSFFERNKDITCEEDRLESSHLASGESAAVSLPELVIDEGSKEAEAKDKEEETETTDKEESKTELDQLPSAVSSQKELQKENSKKGDNAEESSLSVDVNISESLLLSENEENEKELAKESSQRQQEVSSPKLPEASEQNQEESIISSSIEEPALSSEKIIEEKDNEQRCEAPAIVAASVAVDEMIWSVEDAMKGKPIHIVLNETFTPPSPPTSSTVLQGAAVEGAAAMNKTLTDIPEDIFEQVEEELSQASEDKSLPVPTPTDSNGNVTVGKPTEEIVEVEGDKEESKNKLEESANKIPILENQKEPTSPKAITTGEAFIFQKLDTFVEDQSNLSNIPLKPPPPYSPSSSLDSTSFSSKSLLISVHKEKIERVVRDQADIIWEIWSNRGEAPEEDWLPDFESVRRKDTPPSDLSQQQQMDSNLSFPGGLSQPAVQKNFDTLLQHLVYETIKESFQVQSAFTPYIERVRQGPLRLQAQKLKIPKTKEVLIQTVLKQVVQVIPPSFLPEVDQQYQQSLADKEKGGKYKTKKSLSRTRELVDEILLEELTTEDYQWTEWWPEEVLVLHHATNNIIQKLIEEAVEFRKYAFK